MKLYQTEVASHILCDYKYMEKSNTSTNESYRDWRSLQIKISYILTQNLLPYAIKYQESQRVSKLYFSDKNFVFKQMFISS